MSKIEIISKQMLKKYEKLFDDNKSMTLVTFWFNIYEYEYT